MPVKRYWPVVFWFQEYKDPYLVYRPSWSHHKGRLPRGYNTYEGAYRYCLKCIDSASRRNVFHSMPTFIPYVIEGTSRITASEFVTLRLLVQRINVNDED